CGDGAPRRTAHCRDHDGGRPAYGAGRMGRRDRADVVLVQGGGTAIRQQCSCSMGAKLMILSIDPGVRGCGAALWRNKLVVRSDVSVSTYYFLCAAVWVQNTLAEGHG